MKAIILAAGQGKRLTPYTDKRPKAIVEIGGHPLIKYTIDNLRNAGIEDITVVTGYMAEAINFNGLNYIHNPRYAETNMVYSLFCAEKIMNDDLIVSYSDIVFEPKVLQKLLRDKSDISVVVDNSWYKLWKLESDNILDEAETLKFSEGYYIKEIGAKPEYYSQIESQYIGLLKFSHEGLSSLKQIYNDLKKMPPENEIIRGRNLSQLYMTDLLQIMIDRGIKVRGIRTDGGWFEVDTSRRYEKLLAMFKDGTLADFCDFSTIIMKK